MSGPERAILKYNRRLGVLQVRSSAAGAKAQGCGACERFLYGRFFCGRGLEHGCLLCGPGQSRWLMELAMAAAPNPLSMLTTETPLAQLFSIPSRAVKPPKLAP